MKLAFKVQDQTKIKDKYTGAQTPVYRLERLAGLALLFASNKFPENPITEVQPKKVGEYLYVSTAINSPAEFINNNWIVLDADREIVEGIIALVEKNEEMPVYLWKEGAWHIFPHAEWRESGEYEKFNVEFAEIVPTPEGSVEAVPKNETRTYEIPHREKVLIGEFTPIATSRAKQWGLPEYGESGEQVKRHASGAVILQTWEGKGIRIDKTIKEGDEITGAWYWISGKTWDYRDQIKAIEPNREVLSWAHNYQSWVYKHHVLPKAFLNLIGYDPNRSNQEKREAGEVTAEQVREVLQILLREPFEPTTFLYPDRDPWLYPEVVGRPLNEVVVHAIKEVYGSRSNVVIFTSNGDDPSRIAPLMVADIDYFATLVAWATAESGQVYNPKIVESEIAPMVDEPDYITPEALAEKVEAWVEDFTPDKQYGDHKAVPVVEAISPEKDDALSLMPEWLWKQAKTAYGTQEGKGKNSIVWAKFFWPGHDWDCFVLDYDERNGEAFCFVILNGDYQMAEFGYQHIGYLQSQVVGGTRFERDLWWKPITLSDALDDWWEQRGYGPVWGEYHEKVNKQLETDIYNEIYNLWCGSSEEYVVRCDFPGVRGHAYIDTLYDVEGFLYAKFWTPDDWGDESKSRNLRLEVFAESAAKSVRELQGIHAAPEIFLVAKNSLNQATQATSQFELTHVQQVIAPDDPRYMEQAALNDAIAIAGVSDFGVSDFMEGSTNTVEDEFVVPPAQQSGHMEIPDAELEDLFNF